MARPGKRQQFKMNGLKDMQKSLERLPHQLQKRVLKNASAAGARVIRDEARRLVPVDSGDLKRDIVVSRSFKQGGRKYKAETFVYLGIKDAGRYYAHLIEYGSSRQSAQPFMRPAFDNKAQEAFGVMRDKFNKEFEKAIKKLPEWQLKKARRDVRAALRSTKRVLGE